MRFLPGGPVLPDDLLTARDEGQVIFFCGAGISRAKANLPDFYGLLTASSNNCTWRPTVRCITLSLLRGAESTSAV